MRKFLTTVALFTLFPAAALPQEWKALVAEMEQSRAKIETMRYDFEYSNTIYEPDGSLHSERMSTGTTTIDGYRAYSEYLEIQNALHGNHERETIVYVLNEECIWIWGDVAYPMPHGGFTDMVDEDGGAKLDLRTCYDLAHIVLPYAYGFSSTTWDLELYLNGWEESPKFEVNTVEEDGLVRVLVNHLEKEFTLIDMGFELGTGSINTVRQSFDPNGNVVREKLVLPAQDPESGLWYPEEIVDTSYTLVAGESKVADRTIYKLSNVEINFDLDESLFDTPYANANIIQTEESIEFLNDPETIEPDVLIRSQTRDWTPGRTTLLYSFGFLAVALGLFLKFRKKKNEMVK